MPEQNLNPKPEEVFAAMREKGVEKIEILCDAMGTGFAVHRVGHRRCLHKNWSDVLQTLGLYTPGNPS